jgi:hypothetical protein
MVIRMSRVGWFWFSVRSNEDGERFYRWQFTTDDHGNVIKTREG